MLLKNKKLSKFFSLFLTIFLLFNIVFVNTAHAQLSILDPDRKLNETIGAVLGGGVAAAAGYFLDKIAYDTAVWIASGDKDNSPVFWQNSSKYFADVGDGAAGELIAGLTDNPDFKALMSKFGISNLCLPPDLNIQLIFKLNLLKQRVPAAPRCSFKAVTEAYSNLGTPGYWQRTGIAFQPGGNAISSLADIDHRTDEVQYAERQKAQFKAIIEGQAKAPTGKVNDVAVAPKATVEKAQADQSPTVKQLDTQSDARSTKELLANGKIGVAAWGVFKMFSNTLANKMLEKLMSKGLVGTPKDVFSDSRAALCTLGEQSYCPPVTGASKKNSLTSADAQVITGRQAAEAAFADFLTPKISELDQYTYLSALSSSCTDNPNPFCEGIDSDLSSALSKAASGQSVTVKNALESNLLHGNYRLTPPGTPCEKKEVYCYDNLVKLRTLRILPIGWEIAAKLSPKEKNVTLKEVYDAFYDVNSQYYHLIDRNWLLKAPLARCAAEVYGSQLIVQPKDDVPGQRNKYCADIQNCLSENDSGTCEGYGYCLQEKKTWHLGGNSCDAQFNTCTTYTSPAGQSGSYLASTIDRGICDANNTGCKAFYNDKDFNNDKNEWYWKAGGPIYFNAKAEQCLSTAEGCDKFIRAATGVEGEVLNLRKAPDYYECYSGHNISYSSSTLDWWPVNKTDLSKLDTSLSAEKKQACGNYAQVCSAEEKGCELFSPTDGRPAVPGILSTNDQCPIECAGYETYKEEPLTQFSSSSVSYFIPDTAKQCPSQFSGCEEFINLEPSGQGGETKEHYTTLRTCSKDATKSSTYYTWEGSDTTGYQLKSYNLMSQALVPDTSTDYKTKFGDTAGSNGAGPAYEKTDSVTLTGYASKCTATLYQNRLAPNANLDPDCREFYSQAGDKYYRLYTHTITVSPSECRQLRLAEADQSYCDHSGGTWDNTKKICSFLTIQAESTSCPAEFSGCRAYKGNAGNNFETVYSQDFESGKAGQDALQLTGWPGIISSESISVGGKSLKVNSSTNIKFPVDKGKTTQIYFWAKGPANSTIDINVSLSEGGNSPVTQTINLTSEWLLYSVGPFSANWSDSTITQATTTITITGNNFFLDNITGKQMVDNIYVVKNSWNTPAKCDNLLNDPNGESQGGSEANPYRLVPQAQLGCENYTTRQNQPVSIRAFTNLCRAEAVGCEELTDTFNTETTSTSYFNLTCENDSSGVAIKNTTNLPVSCLDVNGNTRCTIAPGQSSCKFNYSGQLTISGSNKKVVELSNNSDIIIKAASGDFSTTAADHTVYLVNDEKYYCKDTELGCSAFGPVQYSLDGAGVKKTTSTETVYLKAAPDNYSDILCQSEAEGCQTYTTTKGSQSYFKDPATKNQFCEYKENIEIKSIPGRAGNVSGWFKKGIGACGTSSGIPTTGSGAAQHPTWCSKDEDCTVAGQTCLGIGLFACFDTGIGGAYSFIATANTQGYQGFAGMCPAQQDGCIQFVDPVGVDPVNKTNGFPYYVLDDDKLDKSSCNGQISTQNNCVLFNQTNKGSLTWNTSSTYNFSQLTNYSLVSPINCGTTSADPNKNNQGCSPGYYNDANTILKVKQDRSCARWLACKSSRIFDKGSGKEVCVEMAECDEYQNNQSLTGRCAHWVDGGNVVKKLVTAAVNPSNGTVSYKNRDVSFGGYDFSGYSIPDDVQIANRIVDSNVDLISSPGYVTATPTSLSCRGYPSATAPLGVNMCSYTKAVFSGKTGLDQIKYLPYNDLLGAGGVCSGGFDEKGKSKDGFDCLTSADCSDDRHQKNVASFSEAGECLQLQTKKVERLRGWEGYCLVDDKNSNSCVQWYPITTPNNNISIEDLNREAGYIPPEGSGKYWCLQAKGNANIGNSTNYQFIAQEGAWNIFAPTGIVGNLDGGGVGINGTPAFNNCFDSTTKIPYSCPTLDQINFDMYIAKHPETYRSGDEIINKYLKRSVHLSELLAIGLQDNNIGDQGPPNNSLIFRDQHLSGVENNDLKLPGDARYWSGPLRRVGDKYYMDYVWAQVSQGPAKEITYDEINKDFYTIYNSNLNQKGNIIALRAVFGSTGYLIELRSKVFVRTPFFFRPRVTFYLTEVCNNIAEVVDNDISHQEVKNSPFGFVSKARTSRIFGNYILGSDRNPADPAALLGGNNFANFPQTFSSFNFINYDQLFAPYGSFNQNNNPGDTEWVSKNTNSDLIKHLIKSGYWPIWLGAGGATPFNCAKIDGGDCSSVTVGSCIGGPLNGSSCGDVTLSNPVVDKLFAQQYCSSPGVGAKCSGDTINASCSGGPHNNVDCKDVAEGSNGVYDWNNADAYCNSNSSKCGVQGCLGGVRNGQACTSFKDCPNYDCSVTNAVTGMCVGGQKNAMLCGSDDDCPPKNYLDASNNQLTEFGVCVGSSLDSGKVIPETVGLNKSYDRLREIFAKFYGLWEWNNGSYKTLGGFDSSNGINVVDYVYNNTTHYDTRSSITPNPPKIYSLVEDKTIETGFTTGTINNFSVNNNNGGIVSNKSNVFPVVINFFAEADKDQMPLTRVAVNWGDGSPVSIVRGWFKNHKPVCDGSSFADLDKTCQKDYFTFKHIYSCIKDGNGWVASLSACEFTPKVQVLDNWGWCSGGNSGYWDGNNLCNLDQSNPWINFDGGNGKIRLVL